MGRMLKIIKNANRDEEIMAKEAEAEIKLMGDVIKEVARGIYEIKYGIEKNKSMFKLDYDSHKSSLVLVFNRVIGELNDVKSLERPIQI